MGKKKVSIQQIKQHKLNEYLETFCGAPSSSEGSSLQLLSTKDCPTTKRQEKQKCNLLDKDHSLKNLPTSTRTIIQFSFKISHKKLSIIMKSFLSLISLERLISISYLIT